MTTFHNRRTIARRTGTVLAALTALALAYFGVLWFLDPAGASAAFGVPLHQEEFAYARVKAAQDLLVALLVGLFLLRRDPMGTALVLAVSVLVPAGDLLTLAMTGIRDVPHLAIHGLAILVTGLATGLLATTSRDDDAGRLVTRR